MALSDFFVAGWEALLFPEAHEALPPLVSSSFYVSVQKENIEKETEKNDMLVRHTKEKEEEEEKREEENKRRRTSQEPRASIDSELQTEKEKAIQQEGENTFSSPSSWEEWKTFPPPSNIGSSSSVRPLHSRSLSSPSTSVSGSSSSVELIAETEASRRKTQAHPRQMMEDKRKGRPAKEPDHTFLHGLLQVGNLLQEILQRCVVDEMCYQMMVFLREQPLPLGSSSSSLPPLHPGLPLASVAESGHWIRQAAWGGVPAMALRHQLTTFFEEMLEGWSIDDLLASSACCPLWWQGETEAPPREARERGGKKPHPAWKKDGPPRVPPPPSPSSSFSPCVSLLSPQHQAQLQRAVQDGIDHVSYLAYVTFPSEGPPPPPPPPLLPSRNRRPCGHRDSSPSFPLPWSAVPPPASSSSSSPLQAMVPNGLWESTGDPNEERPHDAKKRDCAIVVDGSSPHLFPSPSSSSSSFSFSGASPADSTPWCPSRSLPAPFFGFFRDAALTRETLRLFTWLRTWPMHHPLTSSSSPAVLPPLDKKIHGRPPEADRRRRRGRKSPTKEKVIAIKKPVPSILASPPPPRCPFLFPGKRKRER